MSNGTHNTAPLTRLRQLIRSEQQRTNQIATRVRISHLVAIDLESMTASDWHAASNGFTDMEDCERLAGDFFRDGVAAANGLVLSIVGPVIEVADDLNAPDVDITHGIPRASPE